MSSINLIRVISPKFVQDALGDGSEGRIAASVSRVDAGHMVSAWRRSSYHMMHFSIQVAQENPDALADAICAILDTIRGRSTDRAHLGTKL